MEQNWNSIQLYTECPSDPYRSPPNEGRCQASFLLFVPFCATQFHCLNSSQLLNSSGQHRAVWLRWYITIIRNQSVPVGCGHDLNNTGINTISAHLLAGLRKSKAAFPDAPWPFPFASVPPRLATTTMRVMHREQFNLWSPSLMLGQTTKESTYWLRFLSLFFSLIHPVDLILRCVHILFLPFPHTKPHHHQLPDDLSRGLKNERKKARKPETTLRIQRHTTTSASTPLRCSGPVISQS